MFTITITETKLGGSGEGCGAQIAAKIYEQSFDTLDVGSIIAVVNRKRRVRKVKAVKE